jgi:hypothetical protein
MTDYEREQVREAVAAAMEFWPNAHLGDYTRREDLHSAFGMMRRHIAAGESVGSAAGSVLIDALRHEDM